MFLSATKVASFLSNLGFEISAVQEEDLSQDLDAEIVIGNNIVLQVAYGEEDSIEYSLTIEPWHKRRKTSNFRHVGYYRELDEVQRVLAEICTPSDPSELPQVTTWSGLIYDYLKNRQTATLKEIYQYFAGHPRSGKNYQAKIRQVIRENPQFRRIKPGTYTLASNALVS